MSISRIDGSPSVLSSGLPSGLNDRQREAVQSTMGPLIVLAGAGSGKTKMLTSRIAHLIESERVPPYQILAVTFTNKAAAEMRERVERILHSGSSAFGVPEIGTFHSVCVRLLRRELPFTPFTKPFVIYDDSDQLSLIKTALEKLKIDDKAFNPKAMQSGINRAKCDAKEPHELEAATHNVFARNLKRVYEQYQKDLFANNALDFGEIICLTYRLLRDQPDLRVKYQQRFRFLHVDEFQDTNRAQYLLLSMLSSSRFGGHENICVVGDEDQSIYKWRGADIKNILDFEGDYPAAKLVKLEQNYRSTRNILAVANHLIRNNKTRKDKTLWTDNVEGAAVIRAQLADERAEAEMVIAEIKRHAETDGRAYGDFSIFYRTNAQSRQFEDVLRREKIPYQIVGGLRFYDRKEIKDVLSYFKVILNPSDSISLKRIINVPARGIGKTTIEKLEEYHAQHESEGLTFWDVVQRAAFDSSMTSAGAARKLAGFVELFKKLFSEQPKLLLSELYHLILDETSYVTELKKEGTEEALSRIENMEEFDTLIQEFEEEQLETVASEDEAGREAKKLDLLPTFIEQSALASEVDQQDSYASSVKLMTLHSSKGLEFPVVFMVGMEEGLFPSIKPWEETPEEDIEEERRLCYVGMTRAREVLYLMNVVIRRIWGNVSYQEPSRFFAELPDERIEFRDFSYGNRSSEYRTGSSRSFGYGVRPQGQGQGGYAPASHQGQSNGRGSSPSVNPVASPVASYYGSQNGDWVGKQMQHPEYGPGRVVASEGSGNDQKVTIQFLDRQQRKFLLRYIASYF